MEKDQRNACIHHVKGTLTKPPSHGTQTKTAVCRSPGRAWPARPRTTCLGTSDSELLVKKNTSHGLVVGVENAAPVLAILADLHVARPQGRGRPLLLPLGDRALALTLQASPTVADEHFSSSFAIVLCDLWSLGVVQIALSSNAEIEIDRR